MIFFTYILKYFSFYLILGATALNKKIITAITCSFPFTYQWYTPVKYNKPLQCHSYLFIYS